MFGIYIKLIPYTWLQSEDLYDRQSLHSMQEMCSSNAMILWLTTFTMPALVSVVGSQGKDFCDSWVNNDYKIDFGYQIYPYDHEFYNFWYLFIGGHYWNLKYNLERDTISFESTQSRQINLPTDQYRTALACQSCLENETVNTGLLKVISFNLWSIS